MQKLEDEDIARTRSVLRELRNDSSSNGKDGQTGDHHCQGQGCTWGGPKDKGVLAPLLWVSRHAPQSYLQLLSDEAVNASVLRWLKSWDSVVFGRQEGNQNDAQMGGLVRSCAPP
jgi:hypothetical protein